MPHLLLHNVIAHQEVFEKRFKLCDAVDQAIAKCISRLVVSGKILFCGNGGSAADSQDLVAEFSERFTKERGPIAALALSTDTSALTCLSNDYSFSHVFSRGKTNKLI